MTDEHPMRGVSRRRFITTAGAVVDGAFGAVDRARAGHARPMTVSVGRQPWAAGNSPVTAYMMANKTFERYAADAGYDLTVDYRDYPSAAPMVEAFVSGNLQFGMWGNTPIVRLIAQHQPIQLLSVGEGHFRFVLATRKDSPIRNVADLKGKTVGALLGGDPSHNWTRHITANGDRTITGLLGNHCDRVDPPFGAAEISTGCITTRR